MKRPVAPGGHTSSNPPESGGQRYVLISLGFALQALGYRLQSFHGVGSVELEDAQMPSPIA
jgi:hypothetical protein